MNTFTAEIVSEFLRVKQLTSMVIDYLTPENCKADDNRYALTGFYEKCLDAKGKHINRMLEQACYGRHIEIIKLLLSKGANYWNECIPIVCSNGCDIEIVELLANAGETNLINRTDKLCEKGLLTKANIMHTKWMSVVENGLQVACFAGRLDIMRLMTEKGAKDYRLCLIDACSTNRLDIAEFIIGKGASNVKECFDIACERGNVEMVKLMLDNKVDDLKIGFYTACRRGHIGVVELLLNTGNCDLSNGLSGACEGGHSDIVDMIVKRGVTVCSSRKCCGHTLV